MEGAQQPGPAARDHESLVLRAFEAWNGDDWELLETMWDPDAEIATPEEWPEAGLFSGWPAVRRELGRFKDSWVEERTEVLSIKPIADRLLVRFHWVLQGEASGAPLEVDAWMLCEFKKGRLFRGRFFLDRDKALAAARG